jgi:hypothetical protein
MSNGVALFIAFAFMGAFGPLWIALVLAVVALGALALEVMD